MKPLTVLLFAAVAITQAQDSVDVLEAPFPVTFIDSISTERGVVSLAVPLPGDRLYAGTAHELLVFALPGHTGADSVDYPECISSGICTTLDGGLLFIGICSPLAGISVLALPTMEEVARVELDKTPDAMCPSPDGLHIYAACGDDSTVWQVSTADFSVLGPVICSGAPSAITHSPSGDTVYVALEAPVNGIQVVDTGSFTITGYWQTGSNPGGLCTSPGGETVYAALTGDDYVAVYSATDGSMVDSALVGSIPTALAILPDGRFLYTANSLGCSGTVIRARDMTVSGSIRSGFRGGVVCVSPDGSRVFTASGQDGFIFVTGY